MNMGLNEILREFSRTRTLSYARARQPRNYVGLALFPQVPTQELTFEYWKSQNQLPVMANVQAYGNEAQIASRDGANKVSGEIPPIKRKISLNERALIALSREGAGDNQLVSNQLFNDLDNMIDSVLARSEKMRMDAVAKGTIQLNENGLVMNVDYGVPNTHKVTLSGTDLWSDTANSTPITDIQDWTEQVVSTSGSRPARALTSNTVVTNLIKNAQVRTMIYGDAGGSRAVSVNQLNELLNTLNLPQIATYDLQVRSQAENGVITSTRFFPTEKFVLLPPDQLGDTLSGPTAEALLDEFVDSQQTAGIYAAVTHQGEPPSVITKASGTIIPTFPSADSVFQAVVI
jgi:hypothetical protein